jgi:hypothetical protein
MPKPVPQSPIFAVRFGRLFPQRHFSPRHAGTLTVWPRVVVLEGEVPLLPRWPLAVGVAWVCWLAMSTELLRLVLKAAAGPVNTLGIALGSLLVIVGILGHWLTRTQIIRLTRESITAPEHWHGHLTFLACREEQVRSERFCVHCVDDKAGQELFAALTTPLTVESHAFPVLYRPFSQQDDFGLTGSGTLYWDAQHVVLLGRRTFGSCQAFILASVVGVLLATVGGMTVSRLCHLPALARPLELLFLLPIGFGVLKLMTLLPLRIRVPLRDLSHLRRDGLFVTFLAVQFEERYGGLASRQAILFAQTEEDAQAIAEGLQQWRNAPASPPASQ